VIKKAGLVKKVTFASQIGLEEVMKLMDTNLYGPWRMVQEFSFLLKKSTEGRIINISSGMGELAGLKADYPGYRISKASLNALTLMLADEFVPKGVLVYAMCPGWVKTDMGGPDAPRSVEEGADTAVWLATSEGIEPGKFYRDRKVINW
jgi:NAD(P)-dependent dehydrogenase (short-subunit alcohol dehydrogenase family)